MIDSTLDILDVFNTDTVIAVTPDNGTLYKHDGNGLNLFKKNLSLSLMKFIENLVGYRL